jgi:heat shock protein HtpX
MWLALAAVAITSLAAIAGLTAVLVFTFGPIVASGAFVLVVGLLVWNAQSTDVDGRVVARTEQPELHALLDRLVATADVPKPLLAITPAETPNSFVVGAAAERPTIFLTHGLLDRLDIQELEAVVAHELTHIVNRDGGAMMLVSAPMRLADSAISRAKVPVLLFFWTYVVALKVLAWLAMLAAYTFACCREYSADRGAALLTGTPEYLMSALQKIAGNAESIPKQDLRALAPVTAVCIFPSRRGWATHPPLEKRLERLAALARELGQARLG